MGNTYTEKAEIGSTPMDFKKAMYCLKLISEFLGITKESEDDTPATTMLAFYVLIDALKEKERENAKSIDS